jgi:hypothetical protein
MYFSEESMKKYTENDVIRIIFLIMAIKDGKTIQAPNGNGGWVDCKDLIIKDIMTNFKQYRIKD